MSVRDVHLHIGRLVVDDDGAFSAADLEASIGQAIRRRLEGLEPLGTHRSLSELIVDGVLGHPDVTSVLPLADRGRPARPARPYGPPMSISGRDARGPEDVGPQR